MVEKVYDDLKIKVEDVRKKGRTNGISKAKAKIAFRGHRHLGITLTGIAVYLGISNQAVSKLLSKMKKR